jgi:nickel-dependent lactate racemase
MVMDGHAPAGLFIGGSQAAWQVSAELSSRRNVVRHERPFQRILSCAPAMYDELWTAAKAMYKVEPVAALGGEVILHAPHLQEVSRVHGKHIREIGYHILPYFLANWERFKHIPRGVLAHSTHLRGGGVMETGLELPNVRLTLASRITAVECEHLGLGYQDPASIKVEEWMGREAEGILCVPDAGEKLHLLREAEEHGL